MAGFTFVRRRCRSVNRGSDRTRRERFLRRVVSDGRRHGLRFLRMRGCRTTIDCGHGFPPRPAKSVNALFEQLTCRGLNRTLPEKGGTLAGSRGRPQWSLVFRPPRHEAHDGFEQDAQPQGRPVMRPSLRTRRIDIPRSPMLNLQGQSYGRCCRRMTRPARPCGRRAKGTNC